MFAIVSKGRFRSTWVTSLQFTVATLCDISRSIIVHTKYNFSAGSCFFFVCQAGNFSTFSTFMPSSCIFFFFHLGWILVDSSFLSVSSPQNHCGLYQQGLNCPPTPILSHQQLHKESDPCSVCRLLFSTLVTKIKFTFGISVIFSCVSLSSQPSLVLCYL